MVDAGPGLAIKLGNVFGADGPQHLIDTIDDVGVLQFGLQAGHDLLDALGGSHRVVDEQAQVRAQVNLVPEFAHGQKELVVVDGALTVEAGVNIPQQQVPFEPHSQIRSSDSTWMLVMRSATSGNFNSRQVWPFQKYARGGRWASCI